VSEWILRKYREFGKHASQDVPFLQQKGLCKLSRRDLSKLGTAPAKRRKAFETTTLETLDWALYVFVARTRQMAFAFESFDSSKRELCPLQCVRQEAKEFIFSRMFVVLKRIQTLQEGLQMSFKCSGLSWAARADKVYLDLHSQVQVERLTCRLNRSCGLYTVAWQTCEACETILRESGSLTEV